MSPLDGDTVALPPNVGDPDITAARREGEVPLCGAYSPPPEPPMRSSGPGMWRCTLQEGHPGQEHVCGDEEYVVAVFGPGYYRGWEHLTTKERKAIYARSPQTPRPTR